MITVLETSSLILMNVSSFYKFISITVLRYFIFSALYVISYKIFFICIITEPRTRQRLNLKPRSSQEKPAAPAQVASQSSIFGGAKPVDTAAREKEIEERLERLQKEKGELRLPPKDTGSYDNRYYI